MEYQIGEQTISVVRLNDHKKPVLMIYYPPNTHAMVAVFTNERTAREFETYMNRIIEGLNKWQKRTR